jgi:hypothetical protein
MDTEKDNTIRIGIKLHEEQREIIITLSTRLTPLDDDDDFIYITFSCEGYLLDKDGNNTNSILTLVTAINETQMIDHGTFFPDEMSFPSKITIGSFLKLHEHLQDTERPAGSVLFNKDITKDIEEAMELVKQRIKKGLRNQTYCKEIKIE